MGQAKSVLAFEATGPTANTVSFQQIAREETLRRFCENNVQLPLKARQNEAQNSLWNEPCDNRSGATEKNVPDLGVGRFEIKRTAARHNLMAPGEKRLRRILSQQVALLQKPLQKAAVKLRRA